ncbi:HAD-IIA family hydrolase [bacterium]|nr:HAD-IIA family hydrolase [bacterium]
MPLKAILFDADGVLWRGADVIHPAPEFIRRAQAAGLKTLIVSNNAGPNREAYCDKCRRLDLAFAPTDIFSVNHLAGPYLQANWPDARVLVIGSPMLTGSIRQHRPVDSADEWLAQRGATGRPATPDDLKLLADVDYDAVLIGIDVTVNYLKLGLAGVAVQRGARLIGANPDYTFPVPGGVVLPGNGSIVSLVAGVSGVEPLYLGKPSLFLLEQIEAETGLTRTEMVMIGDRPETDYDFARAAGMYTYLVETGVTPPEQMPVAGDDMVVLPTLAEVAQRLGI